MPLDCRAIQSLVSIPEGMAVDMTEETNKLVTWTIDQLQQQINGLKALQDEHAFKTRVTCTLDEVSRTLSAVSFNLASQATYERKVA